VSTPCPALTSAWPPSDLELSAEAFVGELGHPEDGVAAGGGDARDPELRSLVPEVGAAGPVCWWAKLDHAAERGIGSRVERQPERSLRLGRRVVHNGPDVLGDRLIRARGANEKGQRAEKFLHGVRGGWPRPRPTGSDTVWRDAGIASGGYTQRRCAFSSSGGTLTRVGHRTTATVAPDR